MSQSRMVSVVCAALCLTASAGDLRAEPEVLRTRMSTWLKSSPRHPSEVFREPGGCLIQIGMNVELQLTAPPYDHDDGQHIFVQLTRPQSDRVTHCELTAGYMLKSDVILGEVVEPPPPPPPPPPPERFPYRPRQNSQQILVLMYHEIVPSSSALIYDSDVALDQFRAQLQHLRDSGYQTISLAEYHDHLVHGTRLPARPVLITLDDGYIGNFRHAYPLLRQLGMKAVFFVHTKSVGQPGAHDHMSWSQLQTISADPLFEVQSHTVNHLNLTQLGTGVAYEELQDSRRALEAQLDEPIIGVAYPYGGYDTSIAEMANRMYRIAFAVGRHAGDARSMYNIPRLGIGRDVRSVAEFSRHINTFLSRF